MAKVTVVGCGTMGSSLVNSFMNAGHVITIVDVVEKNAAPFVARGASFTSELKNAMDSDFILFNLPNHKIAKKIAESVTDMWKGKMLVNTTTSTPGEILDMQSFILDNGGRYLDAAIECYPAEIGPEHGYIVYAGDKTVFDETEAALTALGRAEFLGDIVISTMMNDFAVGVHYGIYGAMLEGAAVCLKYNYPLKAYLDQIDIILPLMASAAKRQILRDVENYTGEFVDSDEASLVVETAGLGVGLRTQTECGVKPLFSQAIYDAMNECIEDGYGKKSMAVLITKLFDK